MGREEEIILYVQTEIMILNKFSNIFTIDKLLEDAQNINISQDQYSRSYREFIKYFQDLKEISIHNTIIGISFVYSWMPTILNINIGKIEEATLILNKAKRWVNPTYKEFEILKTCFNNSLVGSSKLLHFINPEIFAIWDSRVCRYLLRQKPHSYIIENINTYMDYLIFCNSIIKNNKFQDIKNVIEEKIWYSISAIRVIELIFFYNWGKK